MAQRVALRGAELWRDRIAGAARAKAGTKPGLLGKLKGSLPNIGISRLRKLTF